MLAGLFKGIIYKFKLNFGKKNPFFVQDDVLNHFKLMTNNMIQLMGLPEVVRSEETVDVQSMTQLILKEREKRLNLTKEIIFQKQKNLQLETFIEQLAKSMKFSQETAKIYEPAKVSQQIGAYSSQIRSFKIRKYKMKLKKRRSHVIISREYKGRSISSMLKPRSKGKFTKKQVN